MDHDDSFVVSGSAHEAALIRIAALDERMRGLWLWRINRVHYRNEEDSARNVGNEQDGRDERPRIIRP
jgi:hypothetical protein